MSIFALAADMNMAACTAVYGEDGGVMYTPAGSDAAVQVPGIFDRNFTMVDDSGEVPTRTTKPVLSLRKSDLDALGLGEPETESTVVIGVEEFEVVEVHPDGEAEYRLVLMIKAADEGDDDA